MARWQAGFELAANLIKCWVRNITSPIKDINENDGDDSITIWGAKGHMLVHIVSSDITLVQLWIDAEEHWITKTSLEHSRRLQGHSLLWKPTPGNEDGAFLIECGCSMKELERDYPKPLCTSMEDNCQPSRPSDVEMITLLQNENHDLAVHADRCNTRIEQLSHAKSEQLEIIQRQNRIIERLKLGEEQSQGKTQDMTSDLSSLGKRARDLADDAGREDAKIRSAPNDSF